MLWGIGARQGVQGKLGSQPGTIGKPGEARTRKGIILPELDFPRNQRDTPDLKLHLESRGGRNVFTAYGEDFVELNKVTRYEHSVVVLPDSVIEDWGRAGFAGLVADDFARLAALEPGIVLLGTGTQQRFPSPQLLRPLIEARIGFEIMDVHAACRTYNILTGEGRLVAAALLFDAP